MTSRIEDAKAAEAVLRYVSGLAEALLALRNPTLLPILELLLRDARRLELDLAFSLTLLEAAP